MRDQIMLAWFTAAVDSGTDRLTPIVVAGIGAVAAIVTTIIVAFARKSPEQPQNGLIESLREDVRVRDRRIERRDKEIDRLQLMLMQNSISPVDGKKAGPT